MEHQGAPRLKHLKQTMVESTVRTDWPRVRLGARLVKPRPEPSTVNHSPRPLKPSLQTPPEADGLHTNERSTPTRIHLVKPRKSPPSLPNEGKPSSQCTVSLTPATLPPSPRISQTDPSAQLLTPPVQLLLPPVQLEASPTQLQASSPMSVCSAQLFPSYPMEGLHQHGPLVVPPLSLPETFPSPSNGYLPSFSPPYQSNGGTPTFPPDVGVLALRQPLVSDGMAIAEAVVGMPVPPKIAMCPPPREEAMKSACQKSLEQKPVARFRLENDWLTRMFATLFSLTDRKETDAELARDRECHRIEQSWFDRRAFCVSELEKNRSAYQATDILLDEGVAALDRFAKDKTKCRKWIELAVAEYDRLESLRVGGERLRQKLQAMTDISDWIEYLEGAEILIEQLASEVEKHNDVFWLYLKRLGKEEKLLWRGWMEAEAGIEALYRKFDMDGDIRGMEVKAERMKVVKFKEDYLQTRQFLMRGREWIAPERKFKTMAYIAQKRRRDYHVLETSEKFQIVLSDYPVCPVAPERILGLWNDFVVEPLEYFVDRWRPRKHAKGYC